MEFIHLFRGVAGKSGVYAESGERDVTTAHFLNLKGREAAEARTRRLDEIGETIRGYFRKYSSGLEPKQVKWREENRKRILDYFGGKEEDWSDYRWQLRNVIRKAGPLLDLIDLTPEHQEAVKRCADGGIPFGITPYYLSLMRRQLTGEDSAVRAQVIPPPDYVEMLLAHGDQREAAFDFMGEQDCSPVDLVTRRYPGIAILKPFNTCAQICVYCQRNWEIDQVLDPKAAAAPEKVQAALDWFDDHPGIAEVLITGGDPCVMRDEPLRKILASLAAKEHIQRIRIGTRTPVVLPMRWTDELVALLSEFHVPGRREIAICTHFEHSSEITPEARDAAAKILRAGIGVYNQTVFTMENSRRFEMSKLRRDLRMIGVDPYYTFNMKGKEETRKYMVPIARLLQERKEEARLFPGLDRTDEPVFNVPRLGKNHLRAWQDHRVIMVMPNGTRVYQFHPWEKNIDPVPPYDYTDVPIYGYLQQLKARGENPEDYRTIWFYY